MGRICGHCKEVFLPKRKDVMYCSPSCRQMAYMQRKFVSPVIINNLQEIELQNKPNEKPSIDSLNNQTNETSIDVLEENKKVSIDVLKNVNQTDIPLTNTIINENNISNTTNASNSKDDKPSIEKYDYVESKYINSLANLINDRDNITILNYLLVTNTNYHVFWIGQRLKCLAECLLLFSEMKTTNLEDLKEICNAFTLLIQSPSFKELPAKFPYTLYIKQLREKLKQLIIENQNEEHIQFKINTENKKELMITRFELSHYIQKKKFTELDFSA